MLLACLALIFVASAPAANADRVVDTVALVGLTRIAHARTPIVPLAIGRAEAPPARLRCDDARTSAPSRLGSFVPPKTPRYLLLRRVLC
jgi:hypothetical protein